MTPSHKALPIVLNHSVKHMVRGKWVSCCRGVAVLHLSWFILECSLIYQQVSQFKVAARMSLCSTESKLEQEPRKLET